MFVPNIKTPVSCPVCGAHLAAGAIVTCGQCGSELNFDNQKETGPVVKRGSTPAGRKVVEVIVSRFLASSKIDLAADPMAMQRIIEGSELIAREIAEKGKAKVDFPFITAGPSGPVHLKMELKQEDLN